MAGRHTRRAFIRTTGAAGVAAYLFGGAAAGRPADPITRKDARDLTDDEKAKYREAVGRLKARGPERPRFVNGQEEFPDAASVSKTGYSFQALLHTNHCPHWNWWFFPWHRVYLFYFEQLVRDAVKDFMPGVPVAIPYWDWTEQREVPDLFTGNPATNPLADDRRFYVNKLQDADVGTGVIRDTVDRATPFTPAFGSRAACSQLAGPGPSPFEGGPHGTVHVKVGGRDSQGRPGTLTDPPTAAFDPLFWSHHANIDRLWDHWQTLPRHTNEAFDTRCRPNSTVTWGGLRLTEFVDPAGAALSKSVQEFLTDPVVRSVVYQPHGKKPVDKVIQKGGGGKPMEFTRVKAEVPADTAPRLQVGRPVTLTVPTGTVRDRIRAARAADQGAAVPVTFDLVGVEVPKNSHLVLLRAFLNTDKAGPDTPTTEPGFVGTTSFFGGGHAHGHGEKEEPPTIPLNLAPAIQRLGDKIDPDKPLRVTLVLVPVSGEKEDVAKTDVTVPFKEAVLSIGK